MAKAISNTKIGWISGKPNHLGFTIRSCQERDLEVSLLEAMMVTVSREEAGRRLSHGVSLVLPQTPLVLALSPGGFKVAAELARQLSAPLDVMAVSRLEVPGRRRSVFGAVSGRAAVVLPDRIRQLDLHPEYVYSLIQVARAEVERVTANRRGSASAIPLEGRPVVLVD